MQVSALEPEILLQKIVGHPSLLKFLGNSSKCKKYIALQCVAVKSVKVCNTV